MLAEELLRSVTRSQGMLTLICVATQLLILLRAEGRSVLIRDSRAVLLVGAAAAGAGMCFGFALVSVEAERVAGIVLAALGLLLLGRPAPRHR